MEKITVLKKKLNKLICKLTIKFIFQATFSLTKKKKKASTYDPTQYKIHRGIKPNDLLSRAITHLISIAFNIKKLTIP